MPKPLITSLLTLLILSLFYVNSIHVVAQETHDIMVVSVTPSPTDVQVGDLVNITVVVSNRGTENETFDLTTYYDTNAIETKSVLNLAPNTNTTLIFDWNTTDAGTGIHTIKAEADHLPDETITEDNTLTSPFRVRVTESPYIAAIPGSTVDQAIAPNMNHTISIYTDYDGDDVWGFELELTFNPNVLEGVEVVNGDLITEDVATTMWFPGSFNNTAGTLSLTGNAFFPPLPPAPVPVTSGPGTLVNITFKVVGRGDSYIELGDETRLIGYNSIIEDDFNIIDYAFPSYGHIVGSYFSNQLEVIHDIAIVSVTPSTTEVEEGEFLNVTVVVENEGTVTDDPFIEVYRDYEPGLTFWLVGRKSVSIAAGATESLVFVWNTTDVRPGNHTVTAVAIKIPGEADVEDNVLESGTVVTIWLREEQPIPLLLILGIAFVAVAAIALIWYALKRRSSKRRSKLTR